MLKLEARPQPSQLMSLLRRCWRWRSRSDRRRLFLLLGKDPVRGLQMFFVEPVKNALRLAELAIKATPLMLIALGLAVCFRSNVWNIGAEGQFIVGAWPPAGWRCRPGPARRARGIVVAILLAGVLGGMVWAGDRGAAARPLQRQRDPGQPDAGLRGRACC